MHEQIHNAQKELATTQAEIAFLRHASEVSLENTTPSNYQQQQQQQFEVENEQSNLVNSFFPEENDVVDVSELVGPSSSYLFD